MRKFNISGQHLTEVVLCLAAMSTAILMMRFYLVRTFQAKYKDGADYLISSIKEEAAQQNNLNIKSQYDPYYSESNIMESREGKTSQGFPDSSLDQTMKRAGWQKVGAPNDVD